MSKKVIVSFASSGRENYNKAQLRLIRSCVDAGWDGDYLMRSFDGFVDKYDGVDIVLGSYPVTEKNGLCNNHSEIPFGFKPDLIIEAREKNDYDVVVWCDSTITMERDITQMLNVAKERGVCAFDNLGFPLINWVTDLQQERTGITDEELWEAKQIMACCVIFDFTNPVGKRIFDKWAEMSKDGVSFQKGYGSRRRGFIESRWDQSVLSILLHKEGVELEPYGRLVYEPHDKEPFQYGEEIYFCNRQIS
jgi:hypothetical protein